jgi:hypothetical protein
MDPLQLSQQQQQSSSRERRKKVLEGKKICVTTNTDTHSSAVKPKLILRKPINLNDTLLQHENATSGRENRKRIIDKNKALAASKKICVNSHKQAITKPFIVIKDQAEVAALSREKRKRIIQVNKLDVPSRGPAESSSISTRLNRSNVAHSQKENSTASRDNRRKVLSEKRISPSNSIHNTPTTSKKSNAYTTPLADISNAQKFLYPNQTHVTNTLSQEKFTQPNDEVHSKMPRHSKTGINLLNKFAAATNPIIPSHVEAEALNAKATSPEPTFQSNNSADANESFQSNISSESDTDDEHDSEEHTDSDSDSEDDIDEQNTNVTNIQVGEPALQGNIMV